MSKKAERLGVSPNASLLTRPDLIDAAYGAVCSTMYIQGRLPYACVNSDPEMAKMISGLEFDCQEERDSPQIDADDFLMMLAERWHQSGMPSGRLMVMTDRELVSSKEELGFVTGATSPDLQLSVLSLASVMQSGENYTIQAKVARHLACQRYAIMAGLTYDNVKQSEVTGLWVARNGADVEPCTLNYTADLTETIELTNKLFGSKTAGFCAGCLAKLRNSA